MIFFFIGTILLISIVLAIVGWIAGNKLVPPLILIICGVVGLILSGIFFSMTKNDPWGFSLIAAPILTFIWIGITFGIIWPCHVCYSVIKGRLNILFLVPALIMFIYSGNFIVTETHGSLMVSKYKHNSFTEKDFRKFLIKYNENGQKQQSGFWMFEIIERIIHDESTRPELLIDILEILPGKYASLAAKHKNANEEIFDKIINEKIESAYFGLSRNPNISQEIFYKLANLSDKNVIEGLIENKNTPEDILENIYFNKDISYKLKMDIAFHKNTKESITKDFIVNYFYNENDLNKICAIVRMSRDISQDNIMLILKKGIPDIYSYIDLIFYKNAPDYLAVDFVKRLVKNENDIRKLYWVKGKIEESKRTDLEPYLNEIKYKIEQLQK